MQASRVAVQLGRLVRRCGGSDVRVILDRRVGERRRGNGHVGPLAERRQSERRANDETHDQLTTVGYAFVRLVSGFRMPDVVRTLRYRSRQFGDFHSQHTQAVMRGPSEWSIGERELFAAFVSRLNHCYF